MKSEILKMDISSSIGNDKSFLFDQIGKALPIDYEKIIEASACTENCMFEIYTK